MKGIGGGIPFNLSCRETFQRTSVILAMYVVSGFAELRGASKLSGLAETVKVQPKLLVTTPLPSHAGTQGTQIRQARNYRKENSSHFEQLPLSTILGAHLGQIREEKNYPPFKVLFKYTGRHHYRQNSNFNSEISWLLSAEATFLIPGLVEKREERMCVCEKKPSALSEKHQHRGAARMTGLCTKARARKTGSWETSVLTVASAWACGEPIRHHHVPLQGLRYQAQGLSAEAGNP